VSWRNRVVTLAIKAHLSFTRDAQSSPLISTFKSDLIAVKAAAAAAAAAAAVAPVGPGSTRVSPASLMHPSSRFQPVESEMNL